MSKGKRQANFELLRIVAMFMVVVMHYLANTVAAVPEGKEIAGLDVVYVVLESFCIVAVNVYVLLSGYFLSAAAFSFRRVVRVIGQTLFYTVLIPPVLALLGVISFSEVTDLYRIWNSIFPVQSGHYWFVTAYVVMVLFSPFLNAAIAGLSQKQLRGALAGLLLFFCIGKSFSPLQFATDRYGYDFGWFLVLYLIGGYIRRFGCGRLDSLKKSMAVYLLSCSLIAGAEMVLTWLYGGYGVLAYYWSVPFHYNFLPCLTGALGLFLVFYHMHIKEGKLSRLICSVSPAVFGVYLIHEQNDVRERWFGWVNRLTGRLGEAFSLSLGQQMENGRAVTPVLSYLAILVLQTAVVFAVCIGIDKVRGALFAQLGRRKGGR